ncbi:nucleotidyltransferase-like protein [Larkinella arboricola]|uniref:Nucleotidyltransferase-like protein n=1 Tax=Larkinella arboricola TaxID=643671 RepID=A0A327WQW1_LARAB|nr:nucleotidyltransferase-like protein [Larkinella arboricola]
MHKSRNLTSHTYNEETADEIANAVKNEYVVLLNGLSHRLEEEQNSQQGSLFKSD